MTELKIKTKSKIIIFITLGIIITFLPLITVNKSYLSRDSNIVSFSDPIVIEKLTTSNILSIPVIPIWTYNTASRNRNVAISSNGQYVAVACYDLNLYFFERNNSTPLWSSNLGESVQSVAITPDGQYIVAGTCGNEVYFFEKNNSNPLWSYNTGGIVMSLAISSDGQYFAAGVGRDDYSAYLFEKNSSTPLWRYGTGYAIGHVESVGISSDGNYIVAGAYNGNLYVFGKNSSTPIWTYKTPNWAYHVAISSDGNYIVVGDTAGTNPAHGIYFFERTNSTPLWSYTTWDTVQSVALSSNGQYLVVGTGGDQVYFFERNYSTPLWNFNTGASVGSVAISSDGQYIVAGSYNDKIFFFDRNNSTPLWTYNTISEIESVAISSDGQYFTAGDSTIVNGVSLIYLFQVAVIPQIMINSPISAQSCGVNAPEFIITPYSLFPINSTWYTIDGGLTNYTFSGLTGFINQTAWDEAEDGDLTINFYANNSLGDVGFKEVHILKDSIIPVITIHSPLDDNSFGITAPSFNISIIEENLISTWYTIENETGIFTFSSLTGTIDQDAWAETPQGPINITFYAQDEAGNIGFESVIVIKHLPPTISGYSVFLIIGIIGVISTISIKRYCEQKLNS
ncbi:MAG: WD40 repeat domain-containing protein [Promethearchaeota archaeon]